MISTGIVTVDGVPAKDPAKRVDASSVLVEGEALEYPDGILVMLHKPADYVCSHEGEEGKTVYELLPEQWEMRNPAINSIGRLDKDTTGLLILTDQTELIHQWTSRKSKVEKVYEVTVNDVISPDLVEIFAAGTLMLNGEKDPCLPAFLEITGENQAKVTLIEGRYHQVKRMFAANGLSVTQLHRSRFGKLELGDLEEGQWIAIERNAVG